MLKSEHVHFCDLLYEPVTVQARTSSSNMFLISSTRLHSISSNRWLYELVTIVTSLSGIVRPEASACFQKLLCPSKSVGSAPRFSNPVHLAQILGHRTGQV